jgi:CheY-like chemotaxis protein
MDVASPKVEQREAFALRLLERAAPPAHQPVWRSADLFEERDVKAEKDYGLCLNACPPLQDGNGSGLQILAVEDDQDTAEATAILLRRFGHRVQVASNGPSAWQAALNKPPDVVLLELALPGMDGWDVARRLQEPAWEKKPFVIAITGYGGEEDRRRSLEVGIDLHLAKPIDLDSLRQVLDRFYRIIKPTEPLSATCRNGVPELRLPKTEATKAKHIPIQSQ